MFEHFSADAVKVVHAAVAEAQRCEDPVISAEHLLVGIATARDGPRLLGVEADDVRRARSDRDRDALAAVGIDVALERHVPGRPRRRRHRRFTRDAKGVLDEALKQAIGLQHRRIGVEHLVLAVTARCDDDVVRLLDRLGIDTDRLRATTLDTIRRAA